MNRRAQAALLAALATLLLAPAAKAATYVPPRGQIFEGITDTRIPADFQDFATLVGKPHLPVVQAFHPWGTDPSEAIARWQSYRVRGVLSISTAPGYGLPGTISPREIAQGGGDDYLITLNHDIAQSARITYLRPLGEMNNGHNAYSATTGTGASRGPDYSHYWYRQAWKRIVIVVRGGGPAAQVNAQLAGIGLPALKKVGGHAVPAVLPAPQVAFIWCPLPDGSPAIGAQAAIKYWPGPEYVDWIGSDTYSKYPRFSYLNRFYKRFPGKPFAIGEWGVWDTDSPTWVRQLFRWQRSHPRVRMMIYHMSFGGRSNPLSLFRWPRSAAVTRSLVRGPRFPAYAPGT
jgi:hypothetical protein